jgi:ubiquinone/menaquinone biosynthesis C-methylase UbiE
MLAAGGKVADVGCGHGASTILMGGRFPSSSVYGYDNHAPSIYRARKAAADAGVSANVSFEVAGSGHFPDHGYDLIAFCDCFHDLADPAGAAKRAFETLHDDGAAMIVEPMAGAAPEENFNPIGRVFSGASALC